MLTGGALAATAVLALAALLVPGFVENRRLSRLNGEIARIEPDVRAVERVARELDHKRQLVGVVEKVNGSALQPLGLLRELTEIVPSDAWVTYLALDAKGVEITGQAGAASNLIPLLENSPRLERVEFASPVTRGRDREQFRIRAAWEPPGAVPAVAAAPAGAPTEPLVEPAAAELPSLPAWTRRQGFRVLRDDGPMRPGLLPSQRARMLDSLIEFMEAGALSAMWTRSGVTPLTDTTRSQQWERDVLREMALKYE